MDNLSESMRIRLEKWRQKTGKAPEIVPLTPVSRTIPMTAKPSLLKEYQNHERDYWNLELENERLKRKK